LGYIDRQTRAVVVSVNIYNPNMNKIGPMRIAFEFLASGKLFNDNHTLRISFTGKIVQSATLVPLRASIFATSYDIGLIVIELIVLFYVLLEFVLKEMAEVEIVM
jgi:hypothetical protein